MGRTPVVWTWPRDLTQGRVGRLTLELLALCLSSPRVWLMPRAQHHFPETVPSPPARAPRILANTVILLVGAFGCISSYFIFLTDVFSSTGAAKLIICITCLFIIYGKTQVSRALYDCYLISSAPWNKEPTISILLPPSDGGFRSFSPDLFLQPPALPAALRRAGDHLDHRPCQAPFQTSVSLTPLSNPPQDLEMLPPDYLSNPSTSAHLRASALTHRQCPLTRTAAVLS